MALLVVDPEAMAAAARTTARLAGDLDASLASLGGELGGSGGMAGPDASGRDFAVAYDGAVDALLGGLAATATGFADLADVQFACADAHAAAEAVNAGTAAPGPFGAVAARPAWCPPQPPRAAGPSSGGGPGPHQWVLDACGLVWPGADPPALRLAGDAWARASRRLGGLAHAHPRDAARLLSGCVSEDTALIVGALERGAEDVSALAEACGAVGDACAEFAGHVEWAHSEVAREAWQAGAEAALLTGLTLAAAPLTFGGSVAAGALASSGRAAAVALRLGAVVDRLAALGSAVASRLAALAAACGSTLASLGLGARGLARTAGRVGGPIGRRGFAVGRETARSLSALSGTRLGRALALGRDVVGGGAPAALAGRLGEGAAGVARTGAARTVAAAAGSRRAEALWARALRDPGIRRAAARGQLLAPAAGRYAAALVGAKAAVDAGVATADALIPGRAYADGRAARGARVSVSVTRKLSAARERAEGAGTLRPPSPGRPAASRRADIPGRSADPRRPDIASRTERRVPLPRPIPVSSPDRRRAARGRYP
ncbi:WXG100-like domain-containing protein [Arthrobacter halodurans]|uniref:Outer membrane channel protein CpnT-like N-terminal domain-containing protein n=1 Tax=Arthrobacter halodurans TaxID=516699 RepID=A0ABV4UN45_9MICC